MRLAASLYKMSRMPRSVRRCSSRLPPFTKFPENFPTSPVSQIFRLKSDDSKSSKGKEPPRTAGSNPNDDNEQVPQKSTKRSDKDGGEAGQANVKSSKAVPNSAASTKNHNDGGRPSGGSRGIQASDYKVQELFSYSMYTYYDVENDMTQYRSQQPDANAPMVPDTKR